MKNVAIFLIIFAVGALGILAYYQQDSIAKQRRVVQELTAKLDTSLKASKSRPTAKARAPSSRCVHLRSILKRLYPPKYVAVSKALAILTEAR
jgi:hypothetical protein